MPAEPTLANGGTAVAAHVRAGFLRDETKTALLNYCEKNGAGPWANTFFADPGEYSLIAPDDPVGG